jgi:PAS domain S-box-containing protein
MVHQRSDTTDTKALLSNNQEYYRSLWHDSPVAQLVCQLDGTILDANPAHNALLDRPVVELSLNIWQIATADDPVVRSQCYRSLEQTGKFTAEGEYLTPSQRPFPVRLSGVKLAVGKETLIAVSVEADGDRHLTELQLVLDEIPQYVFWKDYNSVYLGCNQKLAEVAGLKSAAEIVGKTDYDLAWKSEESDWFRECDRRVIASGQPEYDIIESQLQADGSQKWLRTNKAPLRDSEGNIIGVIGTFEDITERVELERELTEQAGNLKHLVELKTRELTDSQVRYQQLSLNVPGVIYQFKLSSDGQFSFPYISGGCQELFELTASEIMNDGDSVISLIHPSDRDSFERAVTASASTLQPKKWQGRLVLASGEIKWVQSASRPQKANGSIIWDGLLMDISDRISAEAELQKSQQLLQLVFDSFPQCVYWKDRNSNYLGCNRQFAKDVGLLTPERVIGKNDFDLSWKQYAHLYQAEDVLIVAGGTAKINQEHTRISPDGRVTWLRSSKLPLKDAEGEIIGVFGSYEDISDRQKERQQTQIATEFLDKAINAINDPIFVKDEDHRWILLNDAFCQFIGYSREELLGKSDYDFFPSEEADIFWAKDELVMVTEREDINRELFTDANGVRQTILTKKNSFKDFTGKTFLVGIIIKIAEY